MDVEKSENLITLGTEEELSCPVSLEKHAINVFVNLDIPATEPGIVRFTTNLLLFFSLISHTIMRN